MRNEPSVPDTIRGLIDAIVLEPEADRLKITLKGHVHNVAESRETVIDDGGPRYRSAS